MDLKKYILVCDAFVELAKPFIETVIHDLESGKITYIKGDLSQREIGDPSLLDLDEDSLQDLRKVIYPKLNFDGRLIKSISIPIENKWLLCLNMDVSIFDQIKDLSEKILALSFSNQPAPLFKKDWQEDLHHSIHVFIKNEGLNFETLRGADKKRIVRFLYDNNAFERKNAADYIAKILLMGRATIFNYLKEWRK